MDNQYDLFVEKHLARNVPLDFNACCDRVRTYLLEGFARRRSGGVSSRYPGLIETLNDGDFPVEEAEEVIAEVEEVHIRYLVIQKTLDRSVPIKPIYKEISSLRRLIEKNINRLADADRDAEVMFFVGASSVEEIPCSMEAFQEAGSISERATIAGKRISAWTEELDEMLTYFDYKQGLVTRGNISLFATKFAVLALADIFEDRNKMGRSAVVSETLDEGRRGPHNATPNMRRYTGRFLDFVTAFFQTVDSQQFARAVDEGFQDRVRKIAKSRKREPELCQKLYGDVSVEDVLDFMRRAERL